MTLIVADTTSSLPLELAAQLGIPVIPQFVEFGDQSFRDDTELTTADSPFHSQKQAIRNPAPGQSTPVRRG